MHKLTISGKIPVSALTGLFLLTAISCNNINREIKGGQLAGEKIISLADTSDITNNFYDNAETYNLGSLTLTVGGEVANPGNIDLEKLPLHTVVVKETQLVEKADRFTGAFRYDGYSLFDILNRLIIKKANEGEFPPVIDLYVEVENDRGDKVNISWGEIYYPNHLHEIIIATRVMRIVPSKTKELWQLPVEPKLVCGCDLISERNIPGPTKITLKSCPKSFVTVKGMSPLYSPDIKIYLNDLLTETISGVPAGMKLQNYPAVFYGRGRGIHSTQPFEGYLLKDFLMKHKEITKESLQTGLIVLAAKDGYRGVFTYSEVMNRNDQAEVLLVYKPEEKDGGVFRLFAAGDFFSDRAIKAIECIYITSN
jgi:hypothetical protein